MSTERDQRSEPAVAHSDGFQPWRKLFHALTGVAIAATLALLPVERRVAVAIAVAALVLLSALDAVRLSSGAVNRLFYRWFSSLASPQEIERPASSTWYALGVLLVVAFVPRRDAVSAVLVLAVADPLASYLGGRWGRRAFLGGTALGSVTFFAVSLAILMARHDLAAAVLAALAATVVERRSGPFDDNLAIPVACAAVLAVLGP